MSDVDVLPGSTRVDAAVPRPAGGAIGVAIATRGRPGDLAETIACVRQQTLPPACIMVCYTAPADLGTVDAADDLELIRSEAGLTRQRNALLRRAHNRQLDLVVFFDDDFLADPNYLAEIAAVRAAEPDIVVLTGEVIHDGIRGPGLAPAQGRALLQGDTGHRERALSARSSGYGCNMAVAMAPVVSEGIWFDETLPLYGWLEDLDFTRRLGRFGRCVKVSTARGVHLGSKSGRLPGVRLGYSQVANPLHLAKRGSITRVEAGLSAGKRIVANLVMAFRPEPFIDRRGRLRGNLRAIRDALRGQIDPMRVTRL